MIQIIAFSSKAAITFITAAQGEAARKLRGERKEKLNIYLLYSIPHLSVLFQILLPPPLTSPSRGPQERNSRTERRINLVKVHLHLSASKRFLSAVTMVALVRD